MNNCLAHVITSKSCATNPSKQPQRSELNWLAAVHTCFACNSIVGVSSTLEVSNMTYKQAQQGLTLLHYVTLHPLQESCMQCLINSCHRQRQLGASVPALISGSSLRPEHGC